MSRSMRALTILAVAIVVGLPAGAQDLFIADGTLVDPRARELRDTGLLIVDGVIREWRAAPPAGFEGAVVDARGRWVVPGLHDLHVHSLVNFAPGRRREFIGSEVAARRMLYAGVTGFLDLFNEEDYVLELRDRMRRTADRRTADRWAADLFAAGPCLTATGGHCTQYPAPTRTIDSPEEARREVAALARKRPDVVKVVYDARPFPTIDRSTLEAALQAASELGIPTVVHIGSWEEARTAVLAGATVVTHASPEEPIPADLPGLFAEHGTYIMPTLALYGGLPDLSGPTGRWRSPLLQAVAPEEVVGAYRSFEPAGSRVHEFLVEARPTVFESLRRLAAAGVPLLAGSDSGNPGTVLGYSLHHELALMVEAGLSPWQALAASTTAAGELLGRRWGLSPGDEGSVVILEASPILDIRNTERIVEVVHHGRVVDRPALSARMFPSFWSREVLAAGWAHVRPWHLLALGVLVALLLVGAAVALRLVRRARSRPR